MNQDKAIVGSLQYIFAPDDVQKDSLTKKHRKKKDVVGANHDSPE